MKQISSQKRAFVKPPMSGARAAVLGLLAAILAISVTAGCTRIHTEKGVEPAWRDVETDTFRRGISTQSDVMSILGPPSQILAGKDGAIFYYLNEEAVGTGVILILYNQAELNTRYDRAIFFFDAGGVLQDFAFSAAPGQTK
jgi:outer membrane protein assembly factor BamE (lipoprotein component of BamABCDE complex)